MKTHLSLRKDTVATFFLVGHVGVSDSSPVESRSKCENSMTVKLTKDSFRVKFDEKEGNRPDVVVVRGGGANENRRGFAAVKEAKNLKNWNFQREGVGFLVRGLFFGEIIKITKKPNPWNEQ